MHFIAHSYLGVTPRTEVDVENIRHEVFGFNARARGPIDLELINAALATLRQSEQALAIRLGYESVSQLRRALMADWGPVIGEKHPPGRKRSVAQAG